MKKKTCIIISVVLSILLCACLFYNLVAGAPTEYESTIRYMISAAGFSVIVSSLSGYSIFKIFLFQVADDEDIEGTKNILNKTSQGWSMDLVKALIKKELSNEDVETLRSFLDNIDNPEDLGK